MKLRKLYWYILFLLLILAFIWLIHFNGLYGQDSYEYLRYARALKEFTRTGNSPGDYFWPMLYPVIGTCFSFIFPLPFAMQLISILSLILSAIYLEQLLTLLFRIENSVSRLYVLLFFLLSPYMLRGSIVIMSDALTIVCIVAGTYYFELYKKTHEEKYFLLIVFLFTAAINTRYAAFVIIFPFAIAALFTFLLNFKSSTLTASIGIILLLILPHLLIRIHSPFSFIHHEWYNTWSPLNLFRHQFNTTDGYSSYFFYNVFYAFFNVFHPAFCFAGIALLVATMLAGYRRLKSLTPYLISVLLYALFMAGIPFQDMRYLLLSFPFVLLMLFPGYQYLAEFFKIKRVGRYIVVSVILIQLALFCRVFLPFYTDNKTEKQVAASMLHYQGKMLCTFSIDGALKNYGYTGKIINMWSTKIDTLQKIDSNLLVLFNMGQFSQVWKNGNPMQNWDFLHKEYRMVKIEDMPDGWTLYSCSRKY